MPRCRYKSFWLGLVLPLSLAAAHSSACNVPVFRYALERWTPDPYVVVVFHEGALAAEQRALVEPLQKARQSGKANLLVNSADVSGNLPAAFRVLWVSQHGPPLPWVVVRYPADTGIEASAWAGPLSGELTASLLDSPAREELGRRLLSGVSAVWLLLEGADQPRNEAVELLLKRESERLSRTLELPKLGPDDPEISADLPLKIAFSTLRISRSDPAERMLVQQLLSWHPNLSKETGPMVFPVFGRARVLPPAIGEGITPQVIETMARLLTGPCSCQIKEMNAGFDLLMNLNWGDAFLNKSPRATADPPMLTGLSQFAASTTNGLAPSHPAPQLAQVALTPATPAQDHLVRNLAALTTFAVVFLAVATFLLRAKSPGNVSDR